MKMEGFRYLMAAVDLLIIIILILAVAGLKEYEMPAKTLCVVIAALFAVNMVLIMY